MDQFVNGDVVHERLGGPIMRVCGVEGDRVRCIVVTKGGSRYRDFKSSDLEKVPPIKRRAISLRF